MRTFLMQVFRNCLVKQLTYKTREEMNTIVHEYAYLVHDKSKQSNGLDTEAVCCGKHLQLRNMLHTPEPPL